MKKRWFALIIILILAIAGYFYVYQDHRNIASEVPEFEVNALELANEFASSPSNSSGIYLNKTVLIFGTVSELNANSLTLDDKIFCQFDDTLSQVKLNTKISIKGRLIGYDDLLEEVKLDQCIINN